MKIDYKLAEKILRIGLGLTILWFGVSQLLNPSFWIGYLPGWAFTQSFISTTTFVYLNGIFETITALFLIFNQMSRIVSILLAIHMMIIIFHLGYNDIAIRDFGIFVGFLSLIFMSENKCFLIKKIITLQLEYQTYLQPYENQHYSNIHIELLH